MILSRDYADVNYDAVVEAKSKTLNFDKIDTSPYGFTVLDTYARLTWENFYVLNSEDSGVGDYGNSGFFTGITSGDQVAYNPYTATDSSISLARGTFNFESVQMTSAWNKRQTVDIEGYDAKGKVIYEATVTINDKGPTNVELNWTNISKITFFYNDDYKPDPKLEGTGNNVVYDDMVLSPGKGAGGAEPVSDSHRVVADGAFGQNSLHESIGANLHGLEVQHGVHVALV